MAAHASAETYSHLCVPPTSWGLARHSMARSAGLGLGVSEAPGRPLSGRPGMVICPLGANSTGGNWRLNRDLRSVAEQNAHPTSFQLAETSPLGPGDTKVGRAYTSWLSATYLLGRMQMKRLLGLV